MSELGPDARQILRNAREGDNPSPADRARIRAALMATIAAGAATTATTAANAANAANAAAEMSLPASVGVTKPIVTSVFGGAIGKGMMVVFLGAVSAGAIAAWPKKSAPSTIVVPRPTDKPVSADPVTPVQPLPKDPEQAVIEPPDAPPEVPPLPTDQRKAPVVRPSTTIATPKAPEVVQEAPESADTLIAETQRLREAHGAMRGGDPEKALALLSEHSAENEGQKLRAERAAARVLALCKLGRVDEARAEAEAFLAQNPQSPLADRVRKACPNSP